MSNIQEFNEATNIIQTVDVSEIFTSLALAVAKTQSKLNENSLNQIAQLSDVKFEGKSLLELGLIPAFYTLEEVNFSTNISLKMAQKETNEDKVGMNANYSTGSGSDQPASPTNKDGVDDKKTDHTLSFLAGEKYTVKIDGKEIVFNPKNNIGIFKNCITMVEEYEDLLYAINNVAEVRTTITIEKQKFECSRLIDVGDTGNGYLCISDASDDQSDDEIFFFKHNDNNGEQISNLFLISKDGFEKTLENVNSSKKAIFNFAFTKEGYCYNTDKNKKLQNPVEMSIFFNNDIKGKKADRIDWGKITLGNEFSFFWKDLVAILNRTGEPFTVTNYTITGDDPYTKNLGIRRAQTLERFLKGIGLTRNFEVKNILIDDIKNSKAKITLDANYFSMVLLDLGSSPLKWEGENCFLASGSNRENDDFQIESENISHSSLEKVKTFIETNEKFKDQYLLETVDDDSLLYLLNKKAKISFQLFSTASTHLKIETVNSEQQNSATGNGNTTPTTTPKTQTDTNTTKGAKETVALGASIDVRYARQFDMNVEGNTSMSAKMVSKEPPEQLKTFILEKIK